ncbi:MAG: hypothetical protein LBV02_01440 [Bacteroidales bacterium]|nr:hypothetical protein [Bacteroidales bacterium]
MANVANLFSGKHLKLKEVTVLQTDEVWINSDFTTLGEVEGEILTIGNYHLKCVKSGVRVLKC